jgi:hypothetical protein
LIVDIAAAPQVRLDVLVGPALIGRRNRVNRQKTQGQVQFPARVAEIKQTTDVDRVDDAGILWWLTISGRQSSPARKRALLSELQL